MSVAQSGSSTQSHQNTLEPLASHTTLDVRQRARFTLYASPPTRLPKLADFHAARIANAGTSPMDYDNLWNSLTNEEAKFYENGKYVGNF